MTRLAVVCVCLMAIADCGNRLGLGPCSLGLAAEWQISTVAGTGQEDDNGRQGSADRMNVAQPFGVEIGPDGALFITEVGHHRIWKLNRQTREMTVIAGSGQKGYGGDGGPAAAAAMNEPYEIRFDHDGHLYIVEMQNHIVRRIDARTGRIETIAGTGEPGDSGDDGPAKQARLKVPHGIVLDGKGGLYIADIGNHRIRRVDLKEGTIDTVAGTGMRARAEDGAPVRGTPLDGPRALDFSDADTMWLALREGNAVYRVDWREGRLRHLAGTGRPGYTGDGGPARQAQLAGPKGIAMGPEGWVYIADTESHTIRRIQTKTGQIETLVGDGKAGDGPEGPPGGCRLDRPHGVWVDPAGRVYIGDSSNNRVRVALPPGVEGPPATR